MDKKDFSIGMKVKEREGFKGDLPVRTGIICENNPRSPMIGVNIDGRPKNEVSLYLPKDLRSNQ